MNNITLQVILKFHVPGNLCFVLAVLCITVSLSLIDSIHVAYS